MIDERSGACRVVVQPAHDRSLKPSAHHGPPHVLEQLDGEVDVICGSIEQAKQVVAVRDQHGIYGAGETVAEVLFPASGMVEEPLLDGP
jgi:hypothetical protein